MTLANILKDRVTIQLKVATQTALGETVIWKPVETRHARVIPLDTKARLTFQQLKSEVTHKIIFRGSVSLRLGTNRILHGSKTYELVEPAQTIENSTIVMVKEV